MKSTIFFLLFFVPYLLFAEADSTKIYFKYIENEDLQTICDVTDIQILKIVSYDTSLRGKVFNIVIREFTEGATTSEKDFGISSEEKLDTVVIGQDTIEHITDMAALAGFGKESDSLVITFAGQLKDKIFKLHTRFFCITMGYELKGGPNYQLRSINSNDDWARVSLKHRTPILAYTPPVDFGSGSGSYCMLSDAKSEDWFAKFKVKHFYIFYLEIK